MGTIDGPNSVGYQHPKSSLGVVCNASPATNSLFRFAILGVDPIHPIQGGGLSAGSQSRDRELESLSRHHIFQTVSVADTACRFEKSISRYHIGTTKIHKPSQA